MGARAVPRSGSRHRGARRECGRGRRGPRRRGGGARRGVPARARHGDRAAAGRGGCGGARVERGRAPLRTREGQGERLRLPRRGRPRRRAHAAARRREPGRPGRARLAARAARHPGPGARLVKLALLGTLLAGGLAALDATPVAQTLASQPLVTATLLGLLWGDWPTAIAVGTVLQILAASTLPIGARTPEDYAVGGVAGAGVALLVASRAPVEHVRQAAPPPRVVTRVVAAPAGQ